jgi:Na+-translocating ferredoxin:NAD+ oxidoreductase RnfD subunit
MSKMTLTQALKSDARYFQMIGQTLFISWGILFFGWHTEWLSMLLALVSVVIFQGIAILAKVAPVHSLRSALITGLGLSLLLRVNEPILMVTAASLAIGQKFLLNWRGYHFWNPANFAIAAMLMVTQDAWVSPAQWGQELMLLLLILFIGSWTLKQLSRWDTALYYMSTMTVLVFIRYQWYLGWDWSVVWHQLTTGSFWLYSLFMITDPMTTPQHKWVRRIWAIVSGVFTFYLQHLKFIPTAAVWSLVIMTPIVPFLNEWWGLGRFYWMKQQKQNI